MIDIESSFFNVEINGPIAHVVMNRPEKANGMSPDFWTDLPKITQALDADMSIRTMVISGEGKHFSSGMDLASFQPIMELLSQEPARAAYALRGTILDLQASFNALEAARFPVIAAIHGACVGAAIDMISACDLRISSEDAWYCIEEINIGMTADVGTLQRMPKLVAPGIVKELSYTGRKFSGQECVSWGFVNSLHADREATIAAAMELAKTIASKSPLAISGVKKSLDYARDHNVADSLDQIATWNSGMLRPEDLMGAIQAKMTKKEALFKDLITV